MTKTPRTADCTTGTTLPWMLLLFLIGFGVFMTVAAAVSLAFGPGAALGAALIAAGICLLLLLGLALAVAVFALCRGRRICLPGMRVREPCPPRGKPAQEPRPEPAEEPEQTCAPAANPAAGHLYAALHALESRIAEAERRASFLESAMDGLDEGQRARAGKLLEGWRSEREAWAVQARRIEGAIGVGYLQSVEGE